LLESDIGNSSDIEKIDVGETTFSRDTPQPRRQLRDGKSSRWNMAITGPQNSRRRLNVNRLVPTLVTVLPRMEQLI
jgi:hypothetical protein